jgi:hypothetical protein
MRIRTIKPEFWLHEGLAGKSEFTRLLAIALLNWSDDEGYFMANPVLIKGQLFPFQDDSKMIPRCLQDLSSVGWIELGTDTQGRDVGRVVNFLKHQRVDKPRPSEIKASSTFLESSKIVPRIIQDASKEEGKGKDGNRKVTGKECELCELPFSSEAFKGAWTDWVAFRKEIKKPVTPTMAKAQLRQLGSLNERRAIAMIEHTIGKGWQGLREQEGAAEMYPEPQERSEEIGEEDLAERLRLNRERRIAQEIEAQGRAPEIIDDGLGELF